MKIMAIICYNDECGLDSYGYNIWQTLKAHFHIYLKYSDIRNVYHHLKGLCALNLLRREVLEAGSTSRYLYRLTEKGRSIAHRYDPYLEILRREAASA